MGDVLETPTPILVYDRIDANRRKTRLLLASFAVVFLPVVSGGAAFIFPLIHVMYASVRPADMAALDLTALSWLYAGFFLVSMAIVALVLVATTDLLISSYGSRVVLHVTRARPVDSGDEPDLVHVVENLCIGAGLPFPGIHVIESAAPNAFATGRNPHDASLVVTRGLLRLLNRRELEGVIAHELSHIGNHDISLNTTLAALIGMVSLPLKMLSAPLRFALRLRGAPRVVAIVVVLFALLGHDDLQMVWWTISGVIASTQFYLPYTSSIWWWSVYAMVVPVYVVFGAPLVALLIRQAVSRQREFLADADAALLTRDPEGLALALVKIGAVGGERLRVDEGTVHLYFVDPHSKQSWLHVVFPSHPSLERRVALLARMGNGIEPSAFQAARNAGATFQHTTSPPDEIHGPLPGTACDETASSGQTAESPRASDDRLTQRYDSSDAGSQVQSAVGTAPPLTPLYEQPNGWSRVLAQLPENAEVIPIATEGHFIRVTMAEHQVGYVTRSAPLTALKNFHQ